MGSKRDDKNHTWDNAKASRLRDAPPTCALTESMMKVGAPVAEDIRWATLGNAKN